MANLLSNASNWTDGDGNCPPACWDGSSYVVTNINVTMRLNDDVTPSADDVFAGTISCVSGHSFATLEDSADNFLLSWDVTTTPTDYSNGIDVDGTPVRAIYLSAGNGGCNSDAVTLTPPVVQCNYNCDCDDASGNRTLKSLRDELARRLGYGAQVDNLPPGMTDLLNSFLQGAQRALYRRYDVLRTERFYTWNMTAGTRYYDLADNRDTCTRKLDPRKITWAGVSQGCGDWTELRCGINPLLYTNEDMTGRPERYEIRQCIEVWPAPADESYQLRLKGNFGLDPFLADTDATTVDDELVFLLALANAKAHYGKPDANNYIQQLETMMMNMVAGAHNTRRYVPGRDNRRDMVYTRPVPLVPFD